MSWGRVRKWLVYALAAWGAWSLVTIAFLWSVHELFYSKTIEEVAASPNGELVAKREVTRGGLGTVWTTRILVEDPTESRRMIYKNRDSDYVPPMRWTSPEQLEVEVHCGRVDHMGNRGAWTEGETPFQRLRVRFIYNEEMCANPEGDE